MPKLAKVIPVVFARMSFIPVYAVPFTTRMFVYTENVVARDIVCDEMP